MSTYDDLPADPIERLKMAAAGRREYARSGSPNPYTEELEREARVYEAAIDIIQSDTSLRLAIPSWLIWPPEDKKRVLTEAANRLLKAIEND